MFAKKGSTVTMLPLLMLLVPFSSLGSTFPDKPSSEHYYVDEAELIKPKIREQIDTTAASLLTADKIPFYVVTIPSLASYDAVTLSIEQYATKLFDNWGIGWQDHNYGILLLISEGDRKARIELGGDWAPEYNSQAHRVMEELIVPAFKREDFSRGIADGVRGLEAMARGRALPRATPPWWYWPASIGGMVLVVLMIVSLFRAGRTGWAWTLIAIITAGLTAVLMVIVRALSSGTDSDEDFDGEFGGGSSGGFGGGSSGGFGGGSSGGGGATGSW